MMTRKGLRKPIEPLRDIFDQLAAHPYTFAVTMGAPVLKKGAKTHKFVLDKEESDEFLEVGHDEATTCCYRLSFRTNTMFCFLAFETACPLGNGV